MLSANCEITIQIVVIQYLWSSIITGPTVYCLMVARTLARCFLRSGLSCTRRSSSWATKKECEVCGMLSGHWVWAPLKRQPMQNHAITLLCVQNCFATQTIHLFSIWNSVSTWQVSWDRYLSQHGNYSNNTYECLSLLLEMICALNLYVWIRSDITHVCSWSWNQFSTG